MSDIKDRLINIIKEVVSENVAVDEIKQHVPTGIKVLDTILNGGFVIGDMVMLVGNPGSGKSTLAAQAAAGFLKQNDKSVVVYIDTEQSFSKERLIVLGNDISRSMVLSEDITIERVFKILDSIFTLKEEDEEVMKAPFAVVWDSIAATGSERAEEVDRPEEMTGYEARLLTHGMKKYTKKLATYNTTLITVNQLREKIQMGPFNSPSEFRWLGDKDIYGAKSIKFLAYTLLFMQPTAPEFAAKTPDTGGSYIVSGFDGITVNVHAIKNKSFRPNIKIPIVLAYNTGFNDVWTSFLFLKKRKKAKSSGAWWKIEGIDKKFYAKDLLNLYADDLDFRTKFDEVVFEELEAFKNEFLSDLEVINKIRNDSVIEKLKQSEESDVSETTDDKHVE